MRGEELGVQRGRSPLTWVIDPIDGTRGFILGQLHWTTLIALNDGERPVLGVVHQPYVGDAFVAVAGGPAQWRRGFDRRVLRSRTCPRLADASLACTTPDMFVTPATRAGFVRVRERVRLTRLSAVLHIFLRVIEARLRERGRCPGG